MGPHDTPTLLLSILLAVAAPAGCLLAWNRLPRSAVLRVGGRVVLILLCQVTALATVGLLINNARGFYASWSEVSADLFGTGFNAGPGQEQSAGGLRQPGGNTGPLTVKKFRYDSGRRTYEARVTGPASGVTGRIVTWLPPEYTDPKYRTTRFPVIELFGGTPGEPTTWFGPRDLDGGTQLAALLRTGHAKPFILVSPEINVAGGRDDECTDLPHAPRVATWLTKDVRDFMRQNFRVQEPGKDWAAMGYSEGAYCATKFALRYPRLFHAGVGIAGTYESTLPQVTHVPKLLKANSPSELVKKRPPVSLLLATGAQDPVATVAEIDHMMAKVKRPTAATKYVLPRGAHGTVIWRQMLPFVFGWLSKRIDGT